MNASTNATHTPSRLLFLCRGESAVRTDAKSLRALGATDISFASGPADALRLLENNGGGAVPGFSAAMDAVICDEQMEDMPVSVFLYTLAGHASLCDIPVLVIASGPKSAALYRAAGICVLERPYTSGQLEEALREATSPWRPSLSQAAFENAGEKGLSLTARERTAKATTVKAPLTTSDLYKSGMSLLKKKEYTAARELFLQVLERKEDHLEACLALARICQVEHDTSGVQGWLVRAAAACMRNNDYNRATHIASMLPVGMRGNIFASEALVRMRGGEYRAAAQSFIEAARQRPDLPLHTQIARACLLTARPEVFMDKICEAFAGLGHKLTATALRRRLLEYPEFRGSSGHSRWLDRYPRLKEAVSVASYAAWAWKQA